MLAFSQLELLLSFEDGRVPQAIGLVPSLGRVKEALIRLALPTEATKKAVITSSGTAFAPCISWCGGRPSSECLGGDGGGGDRGGGDRGTRASALS